MEIDYEALKAISLDEQNKTINAYDESVSLSSHLKLISNMIYSTSQMKLNELALYTYSLNHWLKNKYYESIKKYKPGTIVEFECGLNYFGELSYRHMGIVINEQNGKVLLVPATSGGKYLKKSSEKPEGLWYYRLVGNSEGFDHDCILLLDNLKNVSKKRIIGSFGNILDSCSGEKIFEEIKIEMMSRYFSKQYTNIKNKISNLETELVNAQTQIVALNNENSNLKEKNKKQKEKINALYSLRKSR